MLKIEVMVTGDDARTRDKVGGHIRNALREQMGATSWELEVDYRTSVGFTSVGAATYKNEGRDG